MNFYTAIFHVLLSIFKFTGRSESFKVFSAAELLSILILFNVVTFVSESSSPLYLVLVCAVFIGTSTINYFLFVHRDSYKSRLASLEASNNSESLSLAAIFYIIVSLVLFVWFD